LDEIIGRAGLLAVPVGALVGSVVIGLVLSVAKRPGWGLIGIGLTIAWMFDLRDISFLAMGDRSICSRCSD
jgi:hypothetical protein